MMETDAPAARSSFTFDEALAEHLGALRARDVARFAATLGSDVLVVDGRAGITRGTENVLSSHAEWFASPDDWTFEYTVLMTRAFAGAALALVDVTYRNTPRSEPSRFVLSLVFERDASGAWTFVYDQNTPHPAD